MYNAGIEVRFMMKISSLIVLLCWSILSLASIPYDCTSARPEMPGSHNMVLFGDPLDELYVYHLPLFAGNVNGTQGHILMHVYQGFWKIELDQSTKEKYDEKFFQKRSENNPFPFFSISPRGDRFKVPQMICEENFSLQAIIAYGHVEGNPDFPIPEQLVNHLSDVSVKETVFARRFDASSKTKLTYILFGTSSQAYMAHYLTDDENSFDQIIAVEIKNEVLREALNDLKFLEVTIPTENNTGVVSVNDFSHQGSINNKWMLSTSPLGQETTVNFNSGEVIESRVKIVGKVYFNMNSDLWKFQN